MPCARDAGVAQVVGVSGAGFSWFVLASGSVACWKREAEEDWGIRLAVGDSFVISFLSWREPFPAARTSTRRADGVR
jgi:hypothetical protein